VFIDFSRKLYEKMSELNSGVATLELYEFRYALENIQTGNTDWERIDVPSRSDIRKKISDSRFYEDIILKPVENHKIILDENILELNRALFSGIVNGVYPLDWVDEYFYFDVRGFLFIPRTIYFTSDVLSHLGGKPYLEFERRQDDFTNYHGLGFKDFREANREIDQNLIRIIDKLTRNKGFPIVIAIAGPTAAGKTEFSEYLFEFFREKELTISSVEMDNFFYDRDFREKTGSGSVSSDAIHYDLFKRCLMDLKQRKISEIPRYDFIDGHSSHDSEGNLKKGASTIKVIPSDVIYIEGNFPFLFEEVIPLIDIKVFYLTDDPIRLKRKWKRDIDFRKKYDPNYLCNRYFRTQFLKAESCYRAQLEICDVAVDTTQARIFISKYISSILEDQVQEKNVDAAISTG